MALADQIERVVPLIYEAGTETTLWEHVLEQIVGLLGGHCGSLICRRPGITGGSGVAIGFDPEALRQFWAHYANTNILLRHCGQQPAGTIVTDPELLPRAEFRRSEYYNDFLLKLEDTHSVLTAFLWSDKDRFVVFNCCRSPSRPEFSEEDKHLLRPLMVHLARAIGIGVKLGTVQTEAHDQALLDGTSHGVLVLGRGERILSANPAGEKLLAAKDGLIVSSKGLRAATPVMTAALQAAIARAATGRDGGTVALPRHGSGHPLYALAVPLPAPSDWLRVEDGRVMLLLYDPATRPALAASDLQALFQLTPAEARLAVRLYDGDDLATAAAAFGISRNTARTHLYALMSKTDCRRQGELLQRLATIAELKVARSAVGR